MLAAARERAAEVGAVPIGPATGAALRFLAALVGARAVVEIGTGAGVSTVWLLRGMRPDGVITSVDAEAEHQRLARETLVDAGYPTARARLIAGRAGEVLPRLADSGYDMVFCDTRHGDYPSFLAEAVRLLRPGGVLAFAGVLRGRVAEPGARDAEAVGLRDLLVTVRDDARFVPVLLPLDAGLLAATFVG
ncbi:MAG: O-methyltransferase [Frankiaceae bacterium]